MSDRPEIEIQRQTAFGDDGQLEITETDARAVLRRAPNSYVHTWRAALLVEGYPVWSRGFTTKDATIDLIGRFKTLRKEFLRRATHEY